MHNDPDDTEDTGGTGDPIDPGSRAPLLDTPSGRVSGSWRGPDGAPDVAVFRAVPVAAEHADGPAMFAASAPAPSWSGTLDCSDSPERRSIQATHTATVYCPRGAGPSDGTPYPVITWVHGGRFETGHGDTPWYDGTELARQGCVVVTLNYRKRFEGFLPLEDKAFRGVDDLLLGLRWVRDTVAGVGGDPDEVTLAGQSAGGALVAWLLTDPRSSGLFARAAMLSPGAPRQGWTSRGLTTRLAVRSRVTAETLGSLSAAELTTAYNRFARLHATDCAVGVYPLEVDKLRRVPVFIGTMHDEFVRFPMVRQVDAGLRRLLGKLGLPPTVDAWLLSPAMLGLGVPLRSLPRWCRAVARTEPVRPLGRTVGDRTIRRWASAIAEAMAADGAPVWAYEFSGGTGPGAIEALHCGELPLLFDTLHVGTAEVEERCGPDARGRLGGPGGTGEQFRGAVVDFAHGHEPDWPRFSAPDRTTRVFDMTGRRDSPGAPPRLVQDPLNAVRRLLGRLY